MDTYVAKIILIFLGLGLFSAILIGPDSLSSKGEHLFQVTVNQTVEKKIP